MSFGHPWQNSSPRSLNSILSSSTYVKNRIIPSFLFGNEDHTFLRESGSILWLTYGGHSYFSDFFVCKISKSKFGFEKSSCLRKILDVTSLILDGGIDSGTNAIQIQKGTTGETKHRERKCVLASRWNDDYENYQRWSICRRYSHFNSQILTQKFYTQKNSKKKPPSMKFTHKKIRKLRVSPIC